MYWYSVSGLLTNWLPILVSLDVILYNPVEKDVEVTLIGVGCEYCKMGNESGYCEKLQTDKVLFFLFLIKHKMSPSKAKAKTKTTTNKNSMTWVPGCSRHSEINKIFFFRYFKPATKHQRIAIIENAVWKGPMKTDMSDI